MGLLADFKAFAFKGNVVDLAVGVIIGAAFGKIVASLVENIFMPVVALALPGGDWKTKAYVLKAGATPEATISIKYGAFLGTVLDFLLIAFILFIVVSKLIKSLEGRLVQPAAATDKECPFCTEKVPLAAKKCKHCHSELPALAK